MAQVASRKSHVLAPVPRTREAHRERRAHLIEEPTIGRGAPVADVDRSAEIDPAPDGHLLVDREHRRRAAGRRHARADVVEIGLVAVGPGRQGRAVSRRRFGRMIGIGPAIESLSEDLPNQQAPAALEHPNVAAGIGLTPIPATASAIVIGSIFSPFISRSIDPAKQTTSKKHHSHFISFLYWPIGYGRC